MPILAKDSDETLLEEFTVRQPKTTDLSQIHKVYVSSWQHTYGEYGLNWSEDKIKRDLHRDRLTLPMWSVAEYDGEMVGVLLHSICLRRLEKIFVAPEYLRTGAGHALIRDYLWKVGRAYGTKVSLSLATFTENKRANYFFEQFGYEETDITWTSPSSRKEIVIMKKSFIPLR